MSKNSSRITPTAGADEQHHRLWDAAEPLLATGRLVEGTLMGHACLRNPAGGFVATIHRATGDLVVKLDRDVVVEMIEAGEGAAFAPAGKVFTEWIAISGADDADWSALLARSLAIQGEGA